MGGWGVACIMLRYTLSGGQYEMVPIKSLVLYVRPSRIVKVERGDRRYQIRSFSVQPGFSLLIAALRSNHAMFSYTTNVTHVPGRTRTKFVARPR